MINETNRMRLIIIGSLALGLGLFFTAGSGCYGQSAAENVLPTVEIRSIHPAIFRNWIAADGVFRINWPCLKINLWTNADLKGDETVNRAYYYDKDRRLISKFDKLPNANHPDGGYGVPPLMKAHTDIEVYLPIETKDKVEKWRSVVLVFGDPQNLTVEVYPREGVDWKNFDFPEREQYTKQLKDAEERKKHQTSLPSRLSPLNH